MTQMPHNSWAVRCTKSGKPMHAQTPVAELAVEALRVRIAPGKPAITELHVLLGSVRSSNAVQCALTSLRSRSFGMHFQLDVAPSAARGGCKVEKDLAKPLKKSADGSCIVA